MRLRLLLLAVLLLAGLVPSPAGASTGCGAGRTGLGGSLSGTPDGDALGASVNVELTDGIASRAYDVFTDGRVDTAGRPAGQRYSFIDNVNPELRRRSFGSRHAQLDRTWGAPSAAGLHCFTTNPRIGQAFVEVYPRRPVDDDGNGTTDRRVTDRSRHGGAAHYRQPVRAGEDTVVELRLPARSATGFVHGYVTYQGRAVPVAAPGCGSGGRPACSGITTVRVFPYGSGPDCGVEGFSASADGLDPTAAQGTYFRVDAIAGGRCGAPDQLYSLRVSCASACGPNPAGGPVRVLGDDVRVRTGAGTQSDVRF